MRGPDIIGKRFGRLLVRCKVRDGRWLADCDCGGTRKGYVGEFISGGLTRCQHCNPRLWSAQQDEFLRKNIVRRGVTFCAHKLGKTVGAVYVHCQSLQISAASAHRPWSPADKRYLRRSAGVLKADEIAKKLERTKSATCCHAKTLGLSLETRKPFTKKEVAYIIRHKTRSINSLAREIHTTPTKIRHVFELAKISRKTRDDIPPTPRDKRVIRDALKRGIRIADIPSLLATYHSPNWVEVVALTMNLPVGPQKLTKKGYRVVYFNGRARGIHIFVREMADGRRYEAPQTVHHINTNRADNRLKNLSVWDSAHPRGSSDLYLVQLEKLRRMGFRVHIQGNNIIAKKPLKRGESNT